MCLVTEHAWRKGKCGVVSESLQKKRKKEIEGKRKCPNTWWSGVVHLPKIKLTGTGGLPFPKGHLNPAMCKQPYGPHICGGIHVEQSDDSEGMPLIRFACVVGQDLYVWSITSGDFTPRDFPLSVTLHIFVYISHKVTFYWCETRAHRVQSHVCVVGGF